MFPICQGLWKRCDSLLSAASDQEQECKVWPAGARLAADKARSLCRVQPCLRQGNQVWPLHPRGQVRVHSDVDIQSFSKAEYIRYSNISQKPNIFGIWSILTIRENTEVS